MGQLISLNNGKDLINITDLCIESIKELFAERIYQLKYKNLLTFQAEKVNKEAFLFFKHCAEKIQKK